MSANKLRAYARGTLVTGVEVWADFRAMIILGWVMQPIKIGLVRKLKVEENNNATEEE